MCARVLTATVTGGAVEYGHGFTSFHSSPTGWQNFFVYANQSKPIAFTTPHSGYVPPGAQMAGFGSVGGLLKLDRGVGKGFEGKWKACKVPQGVSQGTWQIYWEGGAPLSPAECSAVTLTVGKATECRLPQ